MLREGQKDKIMIEEKLLQYLCQFRNGSMDIVDAHSSILALIAENKQGVSDSPAQNGALPRVGECNASGESTTEPISESEHGTLDNITDSEKSFVCSKCKKEFDNPNEFDFHLDFSDCLKKL